MTENNVGHKNVNSCTVPSSEVLVQLTFVDSLLPFSERVHIHVLPLAFELVRYVKKF